MHEIAARSHRWGLMCIIVMTTTFILNERFFGILIPKDFHPAATIAIGTALAWCLFEQY